MNTYLQLSLVALLPIAFSAVLFVLEKKTAFGALNYWVKQIIFGVIFGGIAVAATELGVNIEGAVLNVRDAAVASAGLLFGAPAGIIAGVIGGLERFLAVFWGAGEYTRLACTLSTVFVGVICAALRKFMFDNKKPSWFYALAIGIVCEVLHMLMIFVTNFSDISTAFMFVRQCSIPMIIVNALSVTLATVTLTILSKEKLFKFTKNKQISSQFQIWLLVLVLFAGAVTSCFTLFLQNGIAQADCNNLLEINIDDVKNDVSDASDANILSLAKRVRNDVAALDEIDNDALAELAATHSVAEINLVGSDGLIKFSNVGDEYIGFDMSLGAQSAEFMVLLNGADEYVQSYQPISYDASRYRKYAGVATEDGGFIQVGYNAEHFQSDIANTVQNLTRNRHVGRNGSVIIVDMNLNVVSSRKDYDGQIFGDDTTTAPKSGERFSATVYGVECYCMYELNEGYYIISSMPVEEAMFSRDLSTYITVFMEIVVFVGLFILIYFLIKKLVVNNIRKINDSLSEITGGNLDVMINVRTNTEFASLSDDINSTVVTLKKYIAEAASRIDKELEFAKSIQHSALPSVFPPFPDRKDFDIFASMDAAKEVGGDFYDFYFTKHNELVFSVADVSGKGIPAAMFMMRAKSIMKDYAESGYSVEEVLTKANEKLCEGNEADMFVTAWIGKINLDTGLVTYANAGHNPPLVKKKDGTCEFIKGRAGLVLGGMEGVKYRKNEFILAPDELLYLYTDGVTEATDANLQLYGDNRLKDFVAAFDTNVPVEVCKAVKADMDTFVGDAPQFDDITMLAIRFNGEQPEVKELTLNASLDCIEQFTDFVNAALETAECTQKVQMLIDVALDEVLSNIVHYAYESENQAVTVQTWLTNEPKRVYVRFIDSGKEFNPLLKDAPDVTQSAQERKIGGLGIYIVKKSMDSVDYEYSDNHNILTISKLI